MGNEHLASRLPSVAEILAVIPMFPVQPPKEVEGLARPAHRRGSEARDQ